MEVYDKQHGKTALMPYANSEGPDILVHPCSLIWIFSGGRHIQQYTTISIDSVSGQRRP